MVETRAFVATVSEINRRCTAWKARTRRRSVFEANEKHVQNPTGAITMNLHVCWVFASTLCCHWRALTMGDGRLTISLLIVRFVSISCSCIRELKNCLTHWLALLWIILFFSKSLSISTRCCCSWGRLLENCCIPPSRSSSDCVQVLKWSICHLKRRSCGILIAT